MSIPLYPSSASFHGQDRLHGGDSGYCCCCWHIYFSYPGRGAMAKRTPLHLELLAPGTRGPTLPSSPCLSLSLSPLALAMCIDIHDPSRRRNATACTAMHGRAGHLLQIVCLCGGEALLIFEVWMDVVVFVQQRRQQGNNNNNTTHNLPPSIHPSFETQERVSERWPKKETIKLSGQSERPPEKH